MEDEMGLNEATTRRYSQVTPAAAQNYLAANGWVCCVNAAPEGCELYARSAGHGRTRVKVPTAPDLADYASMMHQMVAEVASADGACAYDVLADMLTLSAEMLPRESWPWAATHLAGDLAEAIVVSGDVEHLAKVDCAAARGGEVWGEVVLRGRACAIRWRPHGETGATIVQAEAIYADDATRHDVADQLERLARLIRGETT